MTTLANVLADEFPHHVSASPSPLQPFDAIDELIFELDDAAHKVDPFGFGLPTSNYDGARNKMREVISTWLAKQAATERTS